MDKLSFDSNIKLHLPAIPVSYLKCNFVECTTQVQENLRYEGCPLPFGASDISYSPIVSARYLAEGRDVKTTVEIFLEIKETGICYLPGDSIGILPKNPKHEVLEIIKKLHLEHKADKFIEVTIVEGETKKKIPPYVPKLLTLIDLFESCLDIRSIPKKQFLRGLIEHTGDPVEKRRLEEFCCREGLQEYNNHILDKAVCLNDILDAFPSCQPPIALLIEHLPRLMPRAYSIASSPLEHKNRIRIVFNVIKDSRGRKGVCSSWLERICAPLLDVAAQLENLHLSNSTEEKIIVPIYLRKFNKFRIPQNPEASLIMIGPGTGLAPFIGFLEHKYHQYREHPGLNNDVNNVLYFGCRYKGRDHIYRKEVMNFVTNGTLQNFNVCFSREKNCEDMPKYIQDLIYKEKYDFVNWLMNENTFTFICGDAANLVKDVQETIIKCVSEVKGIDPEEALSIFLDLEKNEKFIKDVWR